MKRLGLGALIALGLSVATAVIAEIITASPIAGNFALVTSGYEIFTDGTNTFHFDLAGEGLLTADGNGNLAGSANFTATVPTPPPNVSAPFSAQCPGALAGTIVEPGDGNATVQLQFSPLSQLTPAIEAPSVGPQEACIPMTIGLTCVEIYPESEYASPLAASGGTSSGGTSASPDPTATPTPAPKKKKHHKADASVIPVDPWPFFYLSSATRLKCIVTGIATSTAPYSVEGESLSLDLQQTAPANVVVPQPVLGSSPVPLPYPSPPVPISIPPMATPGASG